MPELPDLQVFSKNLNRLLAGKKVSKVKVVVPKKLNVSVAQLTKKLEKKKIVKVTREGKELRLFFDDGSVLGLHLMLRGGLVLFDKNNPSRHTILELDFDDGTGLAMVDYQRQATPTLDPEESDTPDALSPEVNTAYLKKLLSGSRATIKNLLLDQHMIRGIGNAYADEILWDAKISPFSVSQRIPAGKVKDLAASIKKVLKNAEKQIKKHHPEIISGEVRDFLDIHNAKNTRSPTGGEILQQQSSSRKTYYTEEQQLYN